MMADSSDAPEPSENLRPVLQKSTLREHFDSLIKGILSRIARVTKGNAKLSVDEIRFVNGEVSEMIGVTFDMFKSELIQDTDIKESDSPEEVYVKSAAADEAADFIQKLTTFVIEKIIAIIAAVWNTVVEIGRKIASFFTDLWSWVVG